MIVFRSLRWKLQSYYACLLLLALGIMALLSVHWLQAIEGHLHDSQLREARIALIESLRSPAPVNQSHWKQFDDLDESEEPTRRERLRGPRAMGDFGGPAQGARGGLLPGPPAPSTKELEQLLQKNWFFGAFGYDGRPLRLSRNFPSDLVFSVPTEPRRGDLFRDAGIYRLLLHREPWGAVTVYGYAKTGYIEGVMRRQWGIIATSGLLFVGATGFGWLLIGRALRPIHAIQDAASLVGAGELDTRIPEETQKDDEIGELSENLNEMFSRFEAMFERQKRFTSEASHELRTPIAVILGYCQMALETDRSPEQVQDAIQACRRAGIRMKNLTNDLLELARLESGEIHFEFAPCSIRDVAEEALELIEPLAAEKGVTLHDEITDATITANGDRLWQVLVNLLNNAVRHTPEGKTITLKTATNGAFLEMFVMDEGEGIPSVALSHIFERFYRVDGSRNRKTGGSGLGLAISETIIKAHGGSITARSVLGEGATFEIRLPI